MPDETFVAGDKFVNSIVSKVINNDFSLILVPSTDY